jgi:hemoglobin
VDRFYDLMESMPEAQTLRAMHPEDMGQSRDRLYWFLVQRFGGPPLFEEKRGHPKLRARHMLFAVDQASVDAWMLCMNQALEEQVEHPVVRQGLSDFFSQVAGHMRNS